MAKPKFPPEIDRLMWAIAENPTPNAVLEFEMRYPSYRLEMLRRVEMVRGLRLEVKGPVSRPREIPRFEPRPPVPSGPPAGAAVAIGVGGVALAVATFTAFHIMSAPKPTPAPPLPVVRSEPVAPPKIAYRDAPNPPQTPVVPSPTPPPDVPSREPVEEQRRDLDVKGVGLVDALSLITSGTRMKLEIGPGFPDQRVTLAFKNKTTREMLFQMAKDYAFTVSDEGDEKYLILPAPDEGASAEANTYSPKIGP